LAFFFCLSSVTLLDADFSWFSTFCSYLWAKRKTSYFVISCYQAFELCTLVFFVLFFRLIQLLFLCSLLLVAELLWSTLRTKFWKCAPRMFSSVVIQSVFLIFDWYPH
jgi:hypothetical protein